jgi:hypothetical protein
LATAFPFPSDTTAEVAADGTAEESWVREWELSEACLFIPEGSFHLMLLIAIVLATTRRDLVVAMGRGLAQCGPYTTYEWGSHQ